jgi:L-alanine-DL-glutamate epimerase-like enolase superfamily enzyme
MKISRVRTYPMTLAVRSEFYIVSSAASHKISRYVLVALDTDAGVTGWGEASVVPEWSGETQGGALALIEDYFLPLLLGRDPTQVESIADAMDAIPDNYFTKAAVEMALLDLTGKSRNQPVYELLGGAENPLEIPIKFSIGLREPDDAASIAAAKIKEGVTAIKVKVGPNSDQDLRRVAAVREAVGPAVRLNIDVNGGWSVRQATREIPRYAELKLEYVEQPTPRWDIEGLAKVRAASDVPIMADEAVFAHWQAEEVIARHAADLISIYPGKNGGILKAQRICQLAQAAGVGCHLGSNLEWDVGTAAMCHLAAACPNVQVTRYPVDILGPLYYSVHPKTDPIRYKNGCVLAPSGPGLGLTITEDDLQELAHFHPPGNQSTDPPTPFGPPQTPHLSTARAFCSAA